VLGFGDVEGCVTGGVAVAGATVGDGVGGIVGHGNGGAGGDAKVEVGAPETAGLGLAAGPAHAANSVRIRRTTTG